MVLTRKIFESELLLVPALEDGITEFAKSSPKMSRMRGAELLAAQHRRVCSNFKSEEAATNLYPGQCRAGALLSPRGGQYHTPAVPARAAAEGTGLSPV